jgi:arylsulfatase A-like enzyme
VAAYDATIASPLIISQPGHIPEGKVCPHPVNSPDLVDLMCRTAGVEIPWKLHSRDIRPLLQNPTSQDWKQPMLMTHTGRSYGADTDKIPTDQRLIDTGKVPWYVMLRDGSYKYIRTLVQGEMEELYDLAADPEELDNLARKPQHRGRVLKLRAEAIEQLKQTDAKFADSMPEPMTLP